MVNLMKWLWPLVLALFIDISFYVLEKKNIFSFFKYQFLLPFLFALAVYIVKFLRLIAQSETDSKKQTFIVFVSVGSKLLIHLAIILGYYSVLKQLSLEFVWSFFVLFVLFSAFNLVEVTKNK
jgi:small-conductance mechanosensitive channel